jgi:GH25 family lysozyme M1 (1,4-beta-N-acetylmuramidase)
MTLFLGDFSHYDGPITLPIAARIKADGIAAVSHKITEGMGGFDAEAATAFASFRAASFEFIGAYAVTRTGDGRAQARVAIARADAIAPWWRAYPGWFWQVDLERWPYDSVSAQDGREMADEFATTGKRVTVYASKTQYGSTLAGWPYPLWNANYPSSRQGPYRALYPGDSGPGWVTYSGQMPAFWQYSSGATIGGLTTCDASAFRGTVDQLRALLSSGVHPNTPEGDMAVGLEAPVPGTGTNDAHKQPRTGSEVLNDIWWALGAAGHTDWQSEALRNTRATLAALAGSQKREEATLAAIAALASGGTSVDTAVVLAAIGDAAAAESAKVAELLGQVADLRAALAAAAQAEAGALAQ